MFQLEYAFRTSLRNSIIPFKCALGLPICIALLVGNARNAYSDGSSSPAGAKLDQFTPTQIAMLVATASGRLKSDAGNAASLKQLQSTLDIDESALIALLRILDRPGVTPKQQFDDLTRSAAGYRAVTSTLAELKYENPDEQQIVEQARAAMIAGDIADAESGMHQIEETEIATIQELVNEGAQFAAAADEHRLKAAQVRMLIGKIAILSLRYADAAEDYERARLLVGPVLSGQSNDTDPQPVAAKAHQLQQSDTAGTATTPVIRNQPESPSATLPQTAAAVLGSSPAALKEQSESPMAEIVVMPSASASLSPQIIETLVRRGDALLAIGDLSSARLLYERAAAAGDPRGAIGTAKTYDPQILAELGARGVQADPATAAQWYRKAFQGSDGTAAVPLERASK